MNKKSIIVMVCIVFIATIYTIFLIVVPFINHNRTINEEVNDKNKYDDLERQQDEEQKRKEEEQKKLEEVEEKEEADEFETRQKEIDERDKEKYKEALANYNESIDHSDNDFKERELIEETNKKIVEKVLKLGFKQINQDCRKDYECYTDGTYVLEYNTKGVYPEFSRITEDPINMNYDSKADLEFFSKLYNLPNMIKFDGIFDEIINTFDDSYNTFSIDSYNINMEVSYYSNELHFRVLHGSIYNYKSNKIGSLDTIITKTDLNNDNKKRMFYYDSTIKYNKGNYPYSDFLNAYLLRDSVDICKIDFEGKNYYNMESSFCHGGTSNTYFRYKYEVDRPRIYDVITVDLKGEYFKENYLNIISNDLKYFSNKGIPNLELSEANKTELTDFIQSNTERKIIIINNDFHIELHYYPNYYNKNFIVKYYVG